MNAIIIISNNQKYLGCSRFRCAGLQKEDSEARGEQGARSGVLVLPLHL